MKKFIILSLSLIVLNAQGLEYVKNPYARAAGIAGVWTALNYNYLKRAGINLSFHFKCISGYIEAHERDFKIITNNRTHEMNYSFNKYLRSDTIFYVSTPLALAAIVALNKYFSNFPFSKA